MKVMYAIQTALGLALLGAGLGGCNQNMDSISATKTVSVSLSVPTAPAQTAKPHNYLLVGAAIFGGIGLAATGAGMFIAKLVTKTE